MIREEPASTRAHMSLDPNMYLNFWKDDDTEILG